jgi:hypothetical protein
VSANINKSNVRGKAKWFGKYSEYGKTAATIIRNGRTPTLPINTIIPTVATMINVTSGVHAMLA